MARAVLTTYSDLETLSGKTFSTAQRTALTAQIALIEDYVARNVVDWEYLTATAKTYDGNGARYLWLPRIIASITSITEDSGTVDSDYYRIGDTGNCIIRDNLDLWSDADDQNIVITGTWGWNTAADARSEFKLMIQMLCLSVLEPYFEDIKGKTSARYGDVAFTWASVEGDMSRNTLLRELKLKYGPLGIA